MIETRNIHGEVKKSNPQAQIDRLIHKKDMVINLCEIKYSNIINKNISD